MARLFHTTAGKKIMGRFAEGRVEKAMKVKWREACFAGGGIEKNLRLKPFSQKITRTAEPPKSFVVDQPGRWISLRHGLYCTEKMAQESNRKLQKNFLISRYSSATMRHLSFNMHPWPYVKFM
jgi:hypothetical protein